RAAPASGPVAGGGAGPARTRAAPVEWGRRPCQHGPVGATALQTRDPRGRTDGRRAPPPPVEPLRLHQVVAGGLERTFPPLKSLEGFRHSLPVVRSSFVGREAEVARVRALLEGARLLTVTGVGGGGEAPPARAGPARGGAPRP